MVHQMQHCTVIVAEDVEDDRLLLEEAFEYLNAGCRVLYARDGLELLERLTHPDLLMNDRSRMPALVLLDLNMPRMNGHETLRAMRSDAQLRDIPVIVWTTSQVDDEEAECYEEGATGFVTKPNSFLEVQKLIRSTLEAWMPGVRTAPAG